MSFKLQLKITRMLIFGSKYFEYCNDVCNKNWNENKLCVLLARTINYILVTKSYNKQKQIGVWFHVGGLGVKQQSNNVLWHNKKKLPTDTVNACIFFKRLLP